MFNRPHIVGLGLALGLCGALVAAVVYSWQPPARPATVLPTKPLTVTELRGEETGEYKRVHSVRGNGSKLRTDIVYRQGATGPAKTRASLRRLSNGCLQWTEVLRSATPRL